MDLVNKFIEAVNSHVDDDETRKSFVGFATDAQSDPVKMQALEAFCKDYTRTDGTFDPIMYENPSYALIDLYDEIVSGNR